MLRFACDWCDRLKEADEEWILGYAAENLGVTAARREVTVLSNWDRERAVHPFAVHFCSEEHKNNYMAELFDTARPQLATTERTKVVTRKKRTVARRRRAS